MHRMLFAMGGLVFTLGGIGVVLFPSTWEAKGIVAPFAEREYTILFVGDIMYDRTIRSYADGYGDDHIFSCMDDALRGYDMVVANLEGPITGNESVSLGSLVGDRNNTRFTMPLRTAEVLFEHNIKAVSLGNNHINDFEQEGIERTRMALDAAGVQYAGDPGGTPSMRLNGMPVVVVPFNEFASGGLEDSLAAIAAQKKEDIVIVFAHWGDEYVPASERQRVWARQFVDAGASLVIGAHPHVIQESEVYNGVPIYYSLGNFIFDQYFSEEVTKGLGLAVTVSKEGIQHIVEVPNERSRDRRTCVVQ